MFAILLALFSTGALAGANVATAQITRTAVPVAPPAPLPSEDFQRDWSDGATIASCEVTWTVPVTTENGINSVRTAIRPVGIGAVRVGEGCPEEYRASVADAAALWTFINLKPKPDQQAVEVRRWFVLRGLRGSTSIWKVEARDPANTAPYDPECVRVATRETPDLSHVRWEGGPAECEVLTWLPDGGTPSQVEVTGCELLVARTVLGATQRWRYKVCTDVLPGDRYYSWTFKQPKGSKEPQGSP